MTDKCFHETRQPRARNKMKSFLLSYRARTSSWFLLFHIHCRSVISLLNLLKANKRKKNKKSLNRRENSICEKFNVYSLLFVCVFLPQFLEFISWKYCKLFKKLTTQKKSQFLAKRSISSLMFFRQSFGVGAW